MRMSRRAVLHGIGGGGVEYSYTGSFDAFGNESQGFLVLKTSGTLTIKGLVDLCLVGGGGKGDTGSSADGGGGGGAGGYVSDYTAQELDGNYSVTIGAGSTSTSSSGGATSVGAGFTANGGNSTSVRAGAVGRGTGGTGGKFSISATNGEDGVFPWGDSTGFSSYRVSGCGGGGGVASAPDPGLGGAGGGGNGGSATARPGITGSVNTGGGGGGGAYASSAGGGGGNGGSGVVFVCWGYTH